MKFIWPATHSRPSGWRKTVVKTGGDGAGSSAAAAAGGRLGAGGGGGGGACKGHTAAPSAANHAAASATEVPPVGLPRPFRVALSRILIQAAAARQIGRAH